MKNGRRPGREKESGRTCGARSWATSAPSRTSTSTRRCCRSRASAPRRTWRGTAASGSPTSTRPRPRATAPPSAASGARSRARTATPASSAPSSGPTSRPAPWVRRSACSCTPAVSRL